MFKKESAKFYLLKFKLSNHRPIQQIVFFRKFFLVKKQTDNLSSQVRFLYFLENGSNTWEISSMVEQEAVNFHI